MSPHSRAWSWLATLLAVALLGVLALGGWALWRPVSADDAARLAALDTASRLRDIPAVADVVGRATLDEQITVLGPQATPSQTRHLASDDAAAPGGGELPAAAAAVIEDARAVRDPALAATLGGIAASWSATLARQDPATEPVTSAEPAAPGATQESGPAAEPTSAAGSATAASISPAEPAAGTEAQRCRPELTATVTGLDRTLYVLEAVTARGPAPPPAQQTALESLREDGVRLLDSPAVAPLLRCTPYPAQGAYVLPAEIASDPVAAAAEAAEDLVRVSAASLAHADPGEREWLLAALERGARAGAVLTPGEPLPAVAGRGD